MNSGIIRKHGRATLALLVAAGWIWWKTPSFLRIWEALFPPVIYFKDCISPFLMGRAAWHGVNPYLPLPQLARMWLQQANPADHPTPYPPAVAVFSLPLALCSYETLARVWCGLELLCVLGTILLLLRWWGASLNPIRIAAIFALAVIWMPLNDELWQGQFMTLLTLLLVGAWLALRSGKDVAGGALLGAMIAIKMMGAPIVLFFLLRRRWRVVFAAAAVAIFANLLAMAVIGPAAVINYYREVGPVDAKLWRPAQGNLSVWAWGIRLFEGVGFSYHLLPLWDARKLAAVATYLLPLMWLSGGLTAAWRARDFDATFSWLVVTTVLFSPIAWHFYLLLTVIPMIVLARRLRLKHASAEAWVLATIFWVLLSIPPPVYDRFIRFFGTPKPVPGIPNWVEIPFTPGLLTLVPVVGLLGLMWLLSRTPGEPDQAAATGGGG